MRKSLAITAPLRTERAAWEAMIKGNSNFAYVLDGNDPHPFVVYCRPTVLPIFRDYAPALSELIGIQRPHGPTEVETLTLSRYVNQRLALQIGIFVPWGQEKVDGFQALVNTEPSSIDGPEVYTLNYSAAPELPGRLVEKPHEPSHYCQTMPTFLAPQKECISTSIVPGQSGSLWFIYYHKQPEVNISLTIECKKGGDYARRRNGAVHRPKFKIKVVTDPFQLPESRKTFGMQYDLNKVGYGDAWPCSFVHASDNPTAQSNRDEEIRVSCRTVEHQIGFFRQMARYGHNSTEMEIFAQQYQHLDGSDPGQDWVDYKYVLDKAHLSVPLGVPQTWGRNGNHAAHADLGLAYGKVDVLIRLLELMNREHWNDTAVRLRKIPEIQFALLAQAGMTKSSLTDSGERLQIPIFCAASTPGYEIKPQDGGTMEATVKKVAQAIRAASSDENGRLQHPELVFNSDELDAFHGGNLLSSDRLAALVEYRRIPEIRHAAQINVPGLAFYGDLLDIWVVCAGRITPELLAEAERQGAEVWTYTHWLRYTNPAANRFFTGLYTWALGLKGNSVYVYSSGLRDLPPPGSICQRTQKLWRWEEITTFEGGMECSFAIPQSSDPESPVAGTGLQGRSEGIEDCRLLEVLEMLMKARANDKKYEAHLSEVTDWIEAIRAQIRSRMSFDLMLDAKSGDTSGWDWIDPNPVFSDADYPEFRHKLMQFIAGFDPNTASLPPREPILGFPKNSWEGHRFDRESVAVCLDALKHGTPKSVQRASLVALRWKRDDDLNSNCDRLVPRIVELLQDRECRIPAMRVVMNLKGGKVVSRSKEILDSLMALTQDCDPYIRVVTIVAMYHLSYNTKLGIKAHLHKLKYDPVYYVSFAAYDACENLNAGNGRCWNRDPQPVTNP